jgi:hypothetical protein
MYGVIKPPNLQSLLQENINNNTGRNGKSSIKIKVLVLCFPDFTENLNALAIINQA